MVFLSSHGADRAGAGQVSFAGEVEKLLASAAPSSVVLRSGGFMENHLASIPTLEQGQLFGVLIPDKHYPLVATGDLGDVAARWLLDVTWTGHHIRGVHGAAELGSNDQATIMSRVLGTPIRYQQIPLQALRDTLIQRGASASVAQGFFDMYSTFARADYRPSEERTAETATPTTFETFVREVLAPRMR